MSKKSILAVTVAIQFALLVFTTGLRLAFASSYDDFGISGSLEGPDYSSGRCEIFTGPRQLSAGATLADNEFLLTIQNSNGSELSLQGTFESEGSGLLELSPKRGLAQRSFTQILRTQAGDPTIQFQLDQLDASATILPVASNVEQADCRVHLTGIATMRSKVAVATGNSEATDDSFSITNPVKLNYKGLGTYFPGVAAQATSGGAVATVGSSGPACNLPNNLQPNPQPCSGTNCLLDFATYKWWTYNQFYSGSGFWNNNNVWSPRNATVDGAGLHLFVRPDNIGNGTSYMSAEAVLLENSDGSIATLGFGTYVVTAQINSAPTWDGLDPNVAFGAFTYEKEQTGTSDNPFREIDLAEISRWGHPAGQTCQDEVPVLCEGNAQFTLQNYKTLPSYGNIRRYTISSSGNQITLVMVWNGANQPVTFKQYNGAFTMATLPSTPPDNQWETTPETQNLFIPDSGCQKFHLNFWMGNFAKAVKGINPPPSSPQEIVVTNFQFKAN
jgi:hypothetical protein